MNPEQFEQYIQGLVSNKKEQTSPIEEVKVESMEGNRDRSPPLTPRIAVSRPIAVVCPQSEVDRPTPLFSSKTRTVLFDSVLDTDSENELELLEEDTESEEDSESERNDFVVIQVDSDSENEENEAAVRNENVD